MSLSPFESLVHSYLDLRWHADPVAATEAGIPGHDHRLGSFDTESTDQYLAALRSIEAAFEEVDLKDLEDEIDRTAVLNSIRSTANQLRVEKPYQRNPVLWLQHALDGAYLLLQDNRGQGSASLFDRLAALPGFLATAAATLEACPGVFLETALDMVDRGVLLFDGIGGAAASGDASERDAVVSRARASLIGFGAFLRDRQDGNTDFAIGMDAFEYRLRFEHAVQSTAPALWSFGVELIKQCEQQLGVAAAELGEPKAWRRLAERLRGDVVPPEQVLAEYRRAVERARSFVADRRLATVPDAPLDVVETPAFMAPLLPLAGYQRAAATPSGRHARLFVTAPGGAGAPPHCVHAIGLLAVHEAYPGHHLQFASPAANRVVRRVLTSPVGVEGWALYAEDLMSEQGFLETPEEQFFHRMALLHRAVRVVTDIGLHTEGMSVSGAVDMLADIAFLDRPSAKAEVRRMCAYPAYHIGYAVGRRDLLAIRSRYRARAGSQFSLCEFHDRVLGYGGLPPSLTAWGLDGG